MERSTAVQNARFELGLRVECRQTNHEGVLIDWLHEAYVAGAKAVLLNAGGYTHTSIAIHDAIKSIKVPVIEVHLSDPMQREEFRHISYVGMAAVAHFAGHGANSYTLALDAAASTVGVRESTHRYSRLGSLTAASWYAGSRSMTQ